MAGVLDGTHAHNGLIDDLLLEGSQIVYWITCLLVRDRTEWEVFRPDVSLLAGSESTAIATDDLKSDAEAWSNRASTIDHCRSTLALVTKACRAAGVAPFDLIRRDLEDLKTRDYLAPYFEHTQ